MELVTDPIALFLDEPTSGYSGRCRNCVMKVLRELADEGNTILLTIHQPSLEVFRMMDKLGVVAKDPILPPPGKLVFFDRRPLSGRT